MDSRVQNFIEQHIRDIDQEDWLAVVDEAKVNLIQSHIWELFKTFKESNVVIPDESIYNIFKTLYGVEGEFVSLYNNKDANFTPWDKNSIAYQISSYLIDKLDTTIIIDERTYYITDIKKVLQDEFFTNIAINNNKHPKKLNLNFNLSLDEYQEYIIPIASVNVTALYGFLYDYADTYGLHIPGLGFVYNSTKFKNLISRIKGKLS